MSYLAWSKTLTVDVPEIDADHRGLVRLANELRRSINTGAPRDKLAALLEDLTGHTYTHFRHEERLMRSAAYPLLLWHKRRHATGRKIVMHMKLCLGTGDLEAGLSLLHSFADWLRDHIRLADRMLGAYIRNYQREQAVSGNALLD